MMAVEVAKPYLDPHLDELLAAMPAPRKALFLDRDGVINVDHGYVHTPEDTEWVPGIFELCARARRAGYLLIVATNQAGIARGYYSVDDFLAYTKWMHEQFARRNVPLAATYYCPHHQDVTGKCQCRKPAPGMLLCAISSFEIEVKPSMLLGDKLSDIKAGYAAGLKASHLINMMGGGLPASLNSIFV